MDLALVTLVCICLQGLLDVHLVASSLGRQGQHRLGIVAFGGPEVACLLGGSLWRVQLVAWAGMGSR